MGSGGDSKLDRQVRTIVLQPPSPEWELAAVALTHEAKNLYNTATFLVRQIITAYDRDKDSGEYIRKAELHPNQQGALTAFNAMIEMINDSRRDKKDPKFLPRLEETMTISPLIVALDVTLLDNVSKRWADGDGDIVYRNIPAVCGQQVVRSVIDVWKASLSAMKDWAKDQSKYTGRPQFPSFLNKDGSFPLEVPFAMMRPGFPKPKVLPELQALGDRSVEFLDRFYSHDLRANITATCLKRGWDEFQPQHIRLIERAGRIRIEAVIALTKSYPRGSFLRSMFDRHGETMRGHKTATLREKFLIDQVRAMEVGDSLAVAGIDVGETNVLTVAFSTGHRAMVHSGKRPKEIGEKYLTLMDQRKAELVSPRQRELQRLKTELEKKNERLSKAEFIELRREMAAIYRDPLYRSLMSRLDRIKSDFEHKITTDIVSRCVTNGIGVIVVGRNKRMKAEREHGTARNRAAHLFAHARLLALLRYKAETHGIAVVTTEESYTSKTSFVDNDELRTYATKQAKAEEDGAGEEQVSEPTAAYSGRRSDSNRNWFNRRNAGGGRLSRVHADVNGAFNIIRKVFADFRYHAGLSLKFNVRRISPRLGAVAPLSCLTG